MVIPQTPSRFLELERLLKQAGAPALFHTEIFKHVEELLDQAGSDRASNLSEAYKDIVKLR